MSVSKDKQLEREIEQEIVKWLVELRMDFPITYRSHGDPSRVAKILTKNIMMVLKQTGEIKE